MNTQLLTPLPAEDIKRHVLAITVDNEPGALARIVGLFSGRGENIESLTVTEIDHERHISLITLVATGKALSLFKIKNQISRLIPVHNITDLSLAERE